MPGKQFGLSPEEEQIMYREWGLFCTKKQILDVADLYYNKSLNLKPDDSKALYRRSQCKRNIAQTADGLHDAKTALALDELRQPFNLEVCDGIYELNEFEETQYTLANYSRKFSGMKVNAFNERSDVVNENLIESLGDTLGYFILENGKNFNKVYNEMVQERTVDNRPLWKILKQQDECDTLSVLEAEKKLLSPREIVRRIRSFTVFNQIYLSRNWVDALFLKTLKTNKDLLLPQSKWSTPILERLTNVKYDILMKLMGMLNSRCPLYTKKLKNCPSRERRKQETEEYLYQIQYLVQRSMRKILKIMHEYREQKKPETLRKYVEQIMGDYVVLKIHRIFPWKLQFTNEVYNILALTLCDQYLEPIVINFKDIPQKDRLLVLLKMDTSLEKEPVPFEFGHRPPHHDSNASDKNSINKALAARLEFRLHFSKYPIEKAYLWHEIARCEFKQNRFDRCCLIAERCIAEAGNCRSIIWKFLGTMMILKTNALVRKIENVSSIIRSASKIAAELKEPRISAFIKKCQHFNYMDVHFKKTDENLRAIMSRQSVQNRHT